MRFDFYWRSYQTIAEVDGALKYDGADGPNRARQQLRRDMLLREDGYEVAHFTWDQITGTPQRVAASIRAAFERGASIIRVHDVRPHVDALTVAGAIA